MQDDDGALLGRQAPKRQLEQIAVGDDRRYIGDRWAVELEELDLHRPSTAPTQHVDTGTGDETAQPGFEAIQIAQCREVSPGFEETLLDRVSRELVVPKDQSGRRVQPRDEHAGEHGKGVAIASLCSLDELSLVHVDLG